MKFGRVINYPRSLARGVRTALSLGMPPADSVRYLTAFTKNARTQLGSPESFNTSKIISFRTRIGEVFIRDRPTDPAALAELIENHYGFSESGEEGAFVDAGAGTGLASRVFSSYNPGKLIFCFEPVKENAELVRLNVPNAMVFDIALGKEESEAEFYIDQKNFMAFRDRRSIKEILDSDDSSKPRAVTVKPLDSFIQTIGKIAMLKLDVEGSEVEILLGARKSLAKTSEVRMETHSPELHERSKEILTKSGFRITREATPGPGVSYLFAKKG